MNNLEYRKNYGSELSAFGLFIGGWIGYLLRPFMLGHQLSIQESLDLISRNDNPFWEPLAYASIEYIIAGAFLGAVVGWVVGKMINR